MLQSNIVSKILVIQNRFDASKTTLMLQSKLFQNNPDDSKQY